MEFIELLALINLTFVFYCITRLAVIETKMKLMKSPEEIAKRILETKIPIVMGPNGPVPLDHSIAKELPNPITG